MSLSEPVYRFAANRVLSDTVAMRISTLLATIPLLLMADDFKLPSNCTLPPVFDRIATKPDPYIVCGNDGAGKGGATPEPAKIREDNAKDNFCADASNPITVDFTILTQMQKKAPNKSTLADSRDSLH